MDYRNETEIWVFHLKRGGGHAVLNWLARTAACPVFHLNNVFSKPFKVRLRQEKVFRAITHPTPRDGPKKRRVYGFDLDPTLGWREVAAMHKEVLMCNVENFRLDRIESEPLLSGRAEEIIGRSHHRKTVLVLRDAFNTFASVRKGKRRMRARLGGFYRHHWKDYAREFLGETTFLPADTIKISYNQWFSDQDYRREIAEKCDFSFSDQGLGEMSVDGGGSSFTGQRFKNKVRDMDVLGRWRHFMDDETYLGAFDDETIELSNRIFGDVTGGEIKSGRV
ncbi:MAG: hypothetical protein K8R59_10245 [Thermoanaerobaculales bacterium]|nr:hypothetical protein [Thermoanaerobaculales bacterium]